ncbi:MAG: hypothetical protein OXK78_16880 [Caldilineaceae bacterium]|nr:hypothetical protein [Caldilineaceae bacterium]
MRKGGGIVALIAGIFAVGAAFITLFVGGIGEAFGADEADVVTNLGWGGVICSFLTIVLGAIAIGTRTRIVGILLCLTAIGGAIGGGALVAIFMALALIGGLFVTIDGGRRKQAVEQSE